jgi:hypothetical protein
MMEKSIPFRGSATAHDLRLYKIKNSVNVIIVTHLESWI